MLLSEARLDAIRQRWEANMPERITVLPQRQTYSTGAVITESYPDPSETGLTVWACRSQPGTPPNELPLGMQTTAIRWWDLAIPAAAVIPPSAKLYHQGPGGLSGFMWNRTLQVLGPEGPRTWQARQIVKCWEELASGAVEV